MLPRVWRFVGARSPHGWARLLMAIPAEYRNWAFVVYCTRVQVYLYQITRPRGFSD